MPELPEVEVTRLGLLPHLPGRTICRIKASGLRLRAPIPKARLEAHILGQTLLTIDRRAKYLLFRMHSGAVLIIHLGMTGRLGLLPKGMEEHQHDHLVLCLDDGREVRFNDSRRFGMIAVWSAAEVKTREEELSRQEGVEPLGPVFTVGYLLQLAQNRRTAVKLFLMNAHLVAGIGNIYASEILFAARIHPQTPARTLSQQQWSAIVTASDTILRAAIAAGGTTIADFLGVGGYPGYFQLQLKVYGRKNLPCPACAHPIIRTVLSGRATYFCPNCQPLAAAP